jgi:hypothetical protein
VLLCVDYAVENDKIKLARIYFEMPALFEQLGVEASCVLGVLVHSTYFIEAGAVRPRPFPCPLSPKYLEVRYLQVEIPLYGVLRRSAKELVERSTSFIVVAYAYGLILTGAAAS